MRMRTIRIKICGLCLMLFFLSPFLLTGAEFAPNYPDFEQMVNEIYQLAENYPELVEIEAYGQSLEKRELLAIHIYKKDGKARPSAMVSGNIHGNEMIGNRMAMAIAWRLVQGAENDPWIDDLLEKMEFWILPCLNPDGYKKTEELYKKGDLAGHRKNVNYVDLNRNFPLPAPRRLKINWAGSPQKEHPNYYGPEPLSEPETRAIKAFLDKHLIFASINFHSVAGVLFPTRCTDHTCVVLHKKMGKAFIKHQKEVKYIYVKWPEFLDTFTGEMEDMQFYFYGTLAIDIELGKPGKNKRTAKKQLGKEIGKDGWNVYKAGFWSFNPINVSFWIENDREAVLYALEKAYQLTIAKPLSPGLIK